MLNKFRALGQIEYSRHFIVINKKEKKYGIEWALSVLLDDWDELDKDILQHHHVR